MIDIREHGGIFGGGKKTLVPTDLKNVKPAWGWKIQNLTITVGLFSRAIVDDELFICISSSPILYIYNSNGELISQLTASTGTLIAPSDTTPLIRPIRTSDGGLFFTIGSRAYKINSSYSTLVNNITGIVVGGVTLNQTVGITKCSNGNLRVILYDGTAIDFSPDGETAISSYGSQHLITYITSVGGWHYSQWIEDDDYLFIKAGNLGGRLYRFNRNGMVNPIQSSVSVMYSNTTISDGVFVYLASGGSGGIIYKLNKELVLISSKSEMGTYLLFTNEKKDTIYGSSNNYANKMKSLNTDTLVFEAESISNMINIAVFLDADQSIFPSQGNSIASETLIYSGTSLINRRIKI